MPTLPHRRTPARPAAGAVIGAAVPALLITGCPSPAPVGAHAAADTPAATAPGTAAHRAAGDRRSTGAVEHPLHQRAAALPLGQHTCARGSPATAASATATATASRANPETCSLDRK